MVPGVAATVSEESMATSVAVSDRKIRRPAPEVPMPTQKCAQQLQTASSSVWPVYMCFPGHFEFAGVARVPRHHIHIQEHIQAIQEHKDHILRF